MFTSIFPIFQFSVSYLTESVYLCTVIDSYVRCSEIISYLNVPGVAILMTNGDLKRENDHDQLMYIAIKV